jgi:hypothetical protein
MLRPGNAPRTAPPIRSRCSSRRSSSSTRESSPTGHRDRAARRSAGSALCALPGARDARIGYLVGFDLTSRCAARSSRCRAGVAARAAPERGTSATGAGRRDHATARVL